jgi:DNA-binding transcriptional regulator YiaG
MSSKLRNARRLKTAKARTKAGLDRALRRVDVRTDWKLAPRPPSSASMRYLRQLLGLTQVMMARQLEVDVLTVKSWENNRRHPTAARNLRMRELAKMNGIDLDQLRDKQYRRKLEIKIFGVEEKSA